MSWKRYNELKNIKLKHANKNDGKSSFYQNFPCFKLRRLLIHVIYNMCIRKASTFVCPGDDFD